MRRAGSAAAVAIACAAVVVGARQQTKPQDPQRPPTFRTEANFVRVDVHATANRVPVPDLKIDDFEVLEDGVPQKVSTFEFVQVRTGQPQDQRTEPNTIQQSRDMMRDARTRIFVVFLDVPHVTIDGTWHVREPLIRLIDRMLGPDDMVGIMTPKMAASDIVFARKTQVLDGSLRDRWPWGERHTLQEDEVDHFYEACFPWQPLKDEVAEMKLRRRERMTLNALRELAKWLREQRDERKAALVISEGWLLYRPNSRLAEPQILEDGSREPVPSAEPVGVGPDGRLRVGSRDVYNAPATTQECWSHRLLFAQMDNDREFRDLIDDANRGNTSFYTIDPRGLPVFDSPLGPAPPPSLEVQRQHLQQRTDMLRVLADNTDGFAVMGSNNLDPGLRRIADDLTSYYLLGYYSGNPKFDGRFRKIDVRVKRPGIDIRARRGYKAATEAEIAAARTAPVAAAVPEAVARARNALGSLARLRPEARFYAHAIAVRGPTPIVWFVGELARPVAAATTASVTVASGGDTRTTDVPLIPGQRAFIGSLTLPADPTTAIDVRVRVAPAGEIPYTDAVRIDAVAGMPLPLLFRRGPSTGNRYEPAGQPQFSRTERLRLDVPRGSGSLTTVTVLDRNGAALDVPVTLSERPEWLSAEVTLAALAPGDYLVELTGKTAGGEERVLTAIRVTR